MSKAQGKLITVKFTQPLVEPSLIPDLTNNLALGKPYTSNGTLDNRGYSATDGNTATANYIESSGTNIYIEVDLGEVIPVSAIKVWHYYNDSRIYNATKTEISEDGINWTTIFDSSIEGTYQESSSGKTHTLVEITNARYIRDWLNGSNKNAGNHWVEIMVFGATLGYNTSAFKVTSKEYQWVDGPDNNGPLIDKEYQVVGVVPHPTLGDNHIRIIFDDYSRFPSVVGDLTVEYDQTLGNLTGLGGAVESFVEVFSPSDLVPEPNPGQTHTVSVAPADLSVDLIPIQYIDAVDETEEHTVTVAPVSLTVELIHIDYVDP